VDSNKDGTTDITKICAERGSGIHNQMVLDANGVVGTGAGSIESAGKYFAEHLPDDMAGYKGKVRKRVVISAARLPGEARELVVCMTYTICPHSFSEISG